jgi:hypothetical protein
METEIYIAQNSAFTNDDISLIINIALIALVTVISLATILTIKNK